MTVKITLVQTQDRLVNQLQQNIRQAVEPPFLQPSGNFITTLTGCTTVPSASISWEAGVDRRLVALVLPTISATSNATTATLTGLPSAIWPKSNQRLVLPIQNNGGYAVGSVVITTDGRMLLASDVSGSAFTNTGAKGIVSSTIVYARSV